jgi:hypothetical protein
MIFDHLVTMSELESFKELIRRCVEGALEARKEFQELLGTSIYNYPRRFFRSDRDEAADFYLYVFDKDRIFRRLKGFRGDNISLENYLRYFVLKDLYLEWLRYKKHGAMDTVPYDDTTDFIAEHHEHNDSDQNQTEQARHLLNRREFFILKLLYLEQCELSAQDIRLLAEMSGRSIGDTLLLLDEIHEGLADRSVERQRMHEKLNEIFMISLSYQKRICELESDIGQLDERHHKKKIQSLYSEKAEYERKLAWRGSQRKRLLQQMADRTVTTSYKDLGRLMNWPLGTVCSKVARARRAFQRDYVSSEDSGPSR